MSEWISVEERLPEPDANVIAVDCCPGDRSHTRVVSMAYRCPLLRRWVGYDDGLDWRCITHWMPMPTPPEATDDK